MSCLHPSNTYLYSKLQLYHDSLLSSNPSSKLIYSIKKALKSIKLYKLQIVSGKDAEMLECIGPYIATKIQGYIEERKKENGDSNDKDDEIDGDIEINNSQNKINNHMHNNKLKRNVSEQSYLDDDNDEQIQLKPKQIKKPRKIKQVIPESIILKPLTSSQPNIIHEDYEPGSVNTYSQDIISSQSKKKEKEYIPKYRTAPYAILISLLKISNYSSLKSDLIMLCKNYTDCEMLPSSNNHYSGWSSMSTLINKNYIKKKGTLYTLTDAGIELATLLLNTLHEDDNADSNMFPSQDKIIPNMPNIINSTFIAHDNYNLSNLSHDILLLLDNRETGVLRTDRHAMQNALVAANVQTLTMGLSLGDACWVARPKNGGPDLVLNCIVERKKVADLEGSILDKRYKEQKMRLSRCGLSRVVYLVEGDIYNSGLESSRVKALESSICCTECVDGFIILSSRCMDGTVSLFKKLTQLLKEEWLKAPFGIPLNEFQMRMKKDADETPLLLFAKQLKMISRVGPDRAVAIAEKYQSMGNLMTQFDSRGPLLGPSMLEDVYVNNRKTTKALSKKIYDFFHNIDYDDGDESQNNINL